MGNCLGSQSDDPNTNRSRTTITTSTPGTCGIGLSALSSGHGEILATPNLNVYSFSDLNNATRGFHRDMILGAGGFGTVYKGQFGSGMNVAIKMLNPQSNQGLREWQSEVGFLGCLSHPNLVKLLGYCFEDPEMLLVYEFMEGRSLDNHLIRMGGSKTDTLSWDLRLKIAIGTARGLAFLHTLDEQVIFRDFKASNILLDGDYNAKISDFGIAKLGPSGERTHVTTGVIGTEGYAAPEYIEMGHLSVKSDVYSFGVLLLEMMSGLRVVDKNRKGKKWNLIKWAKPLLRNKKKLRQVMDAQIEGQYSYEAAISAAKLTLRCLNKNHKKRPSMEEVVVVLEEINDMKVKTE